MDIKSKEKKHYFIKEAAVTLELSYFTIQRNISELLHVRVEQKILIPRNAFDQD